MDVMLLKRRKFRWKFTIVLVILVISFVTLVISMFKIIRWKLDSNETNNKIVETKKSAVIEEVQDNENTEIIEQTEVIPEFNPYWDYIKMSLINVDFSELKGLNNETKGWIQVNGTNINYPFVQAKDNKFYLTHTFDKSYNSAGWVFLDYRNKLDGSDKNTIIYAHGRLDTTMFGSLKNILTSGWLKNSNNYVVKLSTDNENTLWQVFSVYRIPNTSDYIQVNFRSNKEYQDLLNKIVKRSSYNFNTNVSTNDRILTLSTCHSKSEKVVLHAKLIKKEIR
jgi:sortase B